MVHLKDIFTLFDARFDGLTAVIHMKPTIQIRSNIFLTVM